MHRVSGVVVRGTLLAVLAAAAGTASGASDRAETQRCVQPQLTAAYAASVERVLARGNDVWGEALIRSRSGPTYAGAARRLNPLFLAAGPRGRLLTGTGAYYVPFGWPSQFGAQTVALHVADGSAILANRTQGPSLAVGVGEDGRERYGACRSRLATPALLEGYLPALETSYTDSRGVHYTQESFAAHVRETRSLVSFVRLSVDATSAPGVTRLRFSPSARGLALSEDATELVRGDDTFVFASTGAEFDGSSLSFEIQPGESASVYVGWLVEPQHSRLLRLDETSYQRARDGMVAFWSQRLDAGATYDVPEKVVMDAQRSVLTQNLALAWRYSVGDRYHTKLSTPEAIDAATVMGRYGFGDLNRAILDVSFWRRLGHSVNWKMGEQLLGTARYYSLFRDRAYVQSRTPKLARYVAHLRRQLLANRYSLLRRERYSADVYRQVYGLHAQAVAWEGLRAMAGVWSRTGYPALAARSRAVATRLGGGLRRALRRGSKRLHDGSLFIPVRLLDHERPYKRLTATRLGSYWNLVMPYALASGIVEPGSRRAHGVLRYLLRHGSRVLGLVRADAYTLYGNSRLRKSGTDQVYGLNVARFLADNDRADQLVLSLYGQLAAAMTAGTHVAGEAATVAPTRGEYHRKMFLPPNSGSNSAFLETLRLLLVHEREEGGVPVGLELAFATPRAWLAPGRQSQVTDAPTSFGRLSFTLTASADGVSATLDVPRSGALRTLKLRLRVPRGRRLRSVLVEGTAYRRFDSRTGTIDLTGRAGGISLEARY